MSATRTAETLAAMQARYPRALEYVYDQVGIVERGGIRPGEVAAQRFRFEDGLLLIVSRERTPAGKIVLHFSASFTANSRIADEFRLLLPHNAAEELAVKWTESIPWRFRELSDDWRQVEFVGWSDGYIPHFHIRED